MTRKTKGTEGFDLDALFDEARTEQANEALLARVMADAEAVQGEFATAPAPRMPKRGRTGLLAELAAAIGGWRGATGLAATAVAGLWFGLAAPSAVEGLADGLTPATAGLDIAEFMPAFDELMVEG